jgi:hypothetical protein
MKPNDTNMDMNEGGGSNSPRKSIRNISLPRRPAESDASRPAPKPVKRTKHLSIEKEEDAEVTIRRQPSPQLAQSGGRKNWHDHVEEAFLSSDDIKYEQKTSAASKNAKMKDPDDVGNTSTDSHFKPLQAEKKKKHKDELYASTDNGLPLEKSGSQSRAKRTVVVTVLALLAIFGLMHTVFARVSVTLPNGKMSVSLADEALPNAITSTVITKNTEKKVAIESVKTVAVSNKATGTVILYNNYSTAPYDLIKTTRLSTANGSIYRLTQDVTVPGRKTVNGATVPGSVNAKVEAELPGSEYNARGGLDLKLPGLIPGTEKYKQIYAKTSANFTGGSKGTAADLAASGLIDAVKAAETAAGAEALVEARSQNPELVFLEDSINVVSSYDSKKIPAAPTGGGNIEVPVKFTVKVIGLKRDELKKELEAYLMSKSGQPMNISPDVLDFLQYKVAETAEEALAEGKYSIRISGAAEGSFSEELQNALKDELAGKTISEAKSIIDMKFPNKNVFVKAWPFWKNAVPANPEKIKIIILN